MTQGEELNECKSLIDAAGTTSELFVVFPESFCYYRVSLNLPSAVWQNSTRNARKSSNCLAEGRTLFKYQYMTWANARPEEMEDAVIS
jgi:hypothetical protein